MRAINIVKRLAPRARLSYLSAFENGDALLEKHGINTPVRLAHFLAQCLHETGGLTIEWESGAYSAERLLQIFGVGRHSAGVTPEEAKALSRNGPAIFERVYGLGNPKKAKELGNTRPGDGWRYRGGGILQTTGGGNYRRMGVKCGVDFYNHPELVISAEHALKPALAEWTEGGLNSKADVGDLRGITRRINGGYNGLEDREYWLKKALLVCSDFANEVTRSGQVALQGTTQPKPTSTQSPAPATGTPLPIVTPSTNTREMGGGAAGGVLTGGALLWIGVPWWIWIGVAAVGALALGYWLLRRAKSKAPQGRAVPKVSRGKSKTTKEPVPPAQSSSPIVGPDEPKEDKSLPAS